MPLSTLVVTRGWSEVLIVCKKDQN